ncbi:MAG: ABC transporter ATP-binding protein [Patescibacteria group bacterium]|nr:ABC transporter ATP-binding protein [Patescibacteria group bacterium]
MKNNTKITLKIYWQQAWKYKWSFMSMFLLLLIGDAFSILAPYWYKKFFDVLSTNPNVEILYTTLFIILGIKILQWFFIRVMAFLYIKFSTDSLKDLNDACFSKVHKHSFSFFNNSFVGSLVKKVGRFVQAFDRISDRIIWDLLPIIINVTLISIVLFSRNKFFALIIISWIFIFVLTSYFFSKFKLKYDFERSQLDSKVGAFLADSFTNNTNVKLLVGYGRECKEFEQKTEDLRKIRKFSWDISTWFDGIQWMLMILLEIVMLFYAVKVWQAGSITVGDFILIQSYLIIIFEKFFGFGRVIRDFYESLADAEEMTEILNMPYDIQDVKNAKKLQVTTGKIEFKEVSFAYNKTREIIKKMDLVIKPQEKIALVGSSGAGKSTIVKLLLRQHDISGGKILIDGQNIAKCTQESLWQNVSLVPQDPMLFHRSIMENIRYAKPDASDEEVMSVAKQANAHDFILNLADGYNTLVGERGIKLSGGERQRVAIARAILKNSPILILDEATSSLDSKSEKLIQDALGNLMKGKTVIIVAHRLSTIMNSNRILVIEQGGILEQGSHKVLLKKKNGIYRNLWDIQVGGFMA